jgi:hypothetical protein
VTQAAIDEGAEALAAAIGRHRPGSHGVKALERGTVRRADHLFHLGLLDAAPSKTNRDRSA